MVRTPGAVMQCLPTLANQTACNALGLHDNNNWSNLGALSPPTGQRTDSGFIGPIPSLTQWVLARRWQFDGNGPVFGVSMAVGLRVVIECAANANRRGDAMRIPRGGVRLQIGGTTMFSLATPTPASASLPTSRTVVTFGGAADLWTSQNPAGFLLQNSWNDPLFSVAVCFESTTGSNQALVFSITAELFYTDPVPVTTTVLAVTTTLPSVATTVAGTTTLGTTTAAAASGGETPVMLIVGVVLGAVAVAAVIAIVIGVRQRRKSREEKLLLPLLQSAVEEPEAKFADMRDWGTAMSDSQIIDTSARPDSGSFSQLVKDLHKPL